MNRGYEYRSSIEGPDEGRTLLDYLVSRFRHADARTWTSRILEGRVLLDGKPAAADAVVRCGQEVRWRRPPWDEPEAPETFAILHRDEDVMAVAKPAGLPTLPGGGFLQNTLLSLVRRIDPAASPMHRLGRWTSGVVLFARNRESAAGIARQFTERTIGKRYRALAAGSPEGESFEVDTPIGPVPHDMLGTVEAANPVGRPAVSRVRVLERRPDAFVCDVWIDTGRAHQIRIHLAAAGYPLVGDPLYPVGGLPDPGVQAVPGDPGYTLHAAEVRFRHPSTGRTVTVLCAPPAEIR